MSHASAKRSGRIDNIVAEVIDSCRSGTPVDPIEYTLRNPDLMPELGEQIRSAIAIEKAGQTAASAQALGQDNGHIDRLAQLLVESNPDYQVIEKLGAGGQASVYRVFEASTQRTLAIKILDSKALTSKQRMLRFQREIELASRIHHPNIAALHYRGTLADGRPYIVMQCVDGGMPIDEYVDIYEPSPKQIATLFQQVAEAVHVAHRCGVVHRDLKPSNILVNLEGEPFVLDFGLAKDDWEDESQRHLSVDGQVIGTLPYLSPEQALGDTTTPQSDVYALGVVLFLTLTGEFPYDVDGAPAKVIHRIAYEEPSGPIRLLRGSRDPELESIVYKALEKRPEDRYTTANALAEDLARYSRGEAVMASSAKAMYVLRKKIRRYRIQLATGLAFSVLLIAALVTISSLWYRAERIARISMTGLQMGSLVKLGSVERDRGRLDQAISMYTQAIKLVDEFAATDPVVQRQRFNAHYQLASLYIATDRAEEARPYAEIASHVADSFLTGDPQDPHWKRQAAFAALLRGRLGMSLDEWDAADDQLEDAVSRFNELLTRDTGNPSLQQDIAYTQGFQGQCARKLGRLKEAAVYYAESHNRYAQLASRSPPSTDLQLSLVRAANRIAILHISARTTEDNRIALEWLEKATRRLQAIRKTPDAEDYLLDVSDLQNALHANRNIIHKRLAAHDSTSD